MKHYVVVLDWATEDDEAVAILGVTHTYEDAKEIFDKQRIEEMEIIENNGWDIETDRDDMLDAGSMGYWRESHTTLYIQEVN
jgi:hypothetical protein